MLGVLIFLSGVLISSATEQLPYVVVKIVAKILNTCNCASIMMKMYGLFI